MFLVGYADADWAGDLDACKSTFRYVFLLNNGAISWRSKKQTCTALSAMKVEFFCLFNNSTRSRMVEKDYAKLGNIQGWLWANNSFQ